MNECKLNGVLLGKSGDYGNVVRMVGPLCINQKDAEKVISAIDHAVSKYGK
jgi:4-aminobutyrate aminotransferase-like enzyme